jgi:C4-dicarboxylate-specific signal transduction histidine kinase
MNLDRKQKHSQKQKWKEKKKYFSSSTSNRHVFLSNVDSIASKTFEIIDEMSKNNCFANNDSANCAEFSIVKNAQNFLKRKKIVATVERILKRKKSFKSLSRNIDKISSKLRLKNIADNENLASRKWIKNVSNKKATFSASFLKLRIVLFILQQSDSFAQRVWSFVEKASMKHDKKNENVERHDSIKNDDVESNIIRKKVDLDFFFKWNIENDLLRWKNKWYIFSNLLRKEFLKQNHDDSYVDHFEHEKTLNLLKRKYFWNNMSKDVKKYVDSCSTCHRVKFVRHKFYDLLQTLSISENSRQDWTMNFITDLSSSKHRNIV